MEKLKIMNFNGVYFLVGLDRRFGIRFLATGNSNANPHFPQEYPQEVQEFFDFNRTFLDLNDLPGLFAFAGFHAWKLRWKKNALMENVENR